MKLLFSFFYVSIQIVIIFGCSQGIPAVGWIVPETDQVVLAGDSFEVMCVLNESQNLFPDAISRDLRFFVNREPVLNSWVSIIDEISIKLHHNHAAVPANGLQNNVTCKFHDKEICTKYITVGYKPLDVFNFSCISYNWENLTCTWQEQPNPIKTSYSLSYLPQSNPPKAPGYNACPNETATAGSCTWTMGTFPPYSRTRPILRFKMNKSNALAETVVQILPDVDHYAIVLPNKMENLIVGNITMTSALLTWTVPSEFSAFPVGLDFRVSYITMANWIEQTEFIIDSSKLNITEGDDPMVKITIIKELPFKNVNYEVRVSAKSNASQTLWSDPAVVRLKTLPDVPCSGPNITEGSFQQLDEPALIIYWDPVASQCKNGDNFYYEVNVLQAGKYFLSQNVTNSFIKLNSINSTVEYTVVIRSVNDVGYARSSATLTIPPNNQMPSKPQEVLHVRYSPQDFEVLWSKAGTAESNSSVTDSYTIFWCTGESRDQCSGHLSWQIVPASVTAYNVTVATGSANDLQVFVAANKGGFSSGMQRACSIDNSEYIDKVTTLNVTGKSTSSILLFWRPIECEKRISIIQGYRIYAFKVQSNESYVINDVPNTAYSYEISDLESGTEYLVQIAVVSRRGIGKLSEKISGRTLPSPLGWEFWLGIAFSVAAAILLFSIALYCYRRTMILDRVKKLKVEPPWQQTVSLPPTLAPKRLSLEISPITVYIPSTLAYDRILSTTSTLSSILTDSVDSDYRSVSCDTASTCTPKSDYEMQWSPSSKEAFTEFTEVEKDDEETTEKDISALGHMQQPYVQLGAINATGANYVALGNTDILSSPSPSVTSADSMDEMLPYNPYVQLGEYVFAAGNIGI